MNGVIEQNNFAEHTGNELVSASSEQSEFNNGSNVVHKGRWVLTYSELRGVLSRPMPPRYASTLCEKKVQYLEPLLKEVSGEKDLSKLLLLVAPSSQAYFCKKLHCFNRETRRHLSSTRITLKELELMKKYQMMFKYEFVYTEENFSVKLLATNHIVVEAIIDKCKEEHLFYEPEPSIKALRKPLIQVRLRPNDLNRNRRPCNTLLWKY